MAHRKNLWALGAALALCFLAGGAAVIWGVKSVRPISEQLPEDYSHLYVQIVSPIPKSRLPLNSFVPILVQAQAQERIKQVEVFINNTPLAPRNGSADSFSDAWTWQPGVAGEFVLTARVTSQSGAVSLSTPVQITAIDAGYTLSPINAKSGETLQSIAKQKGIPIEQMQQSNPNLKDQDPLKAGQLVFVPNHPAPITNQNIILPLSADNQPSQGNGGTGPASKLPFTPKTNIVNDLNFMLQFNNPPKNGSQSGPKYPPASPHLYGDFKGCDVNLRFDGQNFEDTPYDVAQGFMGIEEDGFFVYRSRDGARAERIYTIPPIHSYMDSVNNSQFTDKGQYGTLVYHLTAFNTLGEASSNPLTIALNPGVCPPPGNAGSSDAIHMDSNGDIILPFQMDTAYLYLQINGSGAVRIPEGSRMFLPGSGMRFNIYSYLSTQVDKVQSPDLKLHMEVWGWQGGALKYAGAFDTESHGTVLTICSVEGEGACANGNGSWVSSVNLPHDKPLKDLVYDMRWQVTSLTTAEDVSLWLSQQPLTEQEGFSNSKGLIFAGSLRWWTSNGKEVNTTGNEGVFSLRLGDMLYPNPPPKDTGWDNTPSKLGEYRSDGFLEQAVGQAFTLYARVTPKLTMQGYEHASNSVSLLYDTSALPPADMPPLVSPYSSMYTVEILRDQFKQSSHAVDEAWGCVVVDEDPTGQYKVGQTVCPPVASSGYEWFPADDPCGSLLGWLQNCVLGGFEAAYGMVKNTLAQGLIDLVPGCGDSSKCQNIMHTAVDWGAAYVTGIPPDLPNAEDLVSGQISSEIIDLATGGVSSATGLDQSVLNGFCDNVADCQGKLSEPIKAQLKQARSQASQTACSDVIGAYYHNVEAFCLDPSIVVHPAPGAQNSPAVALIRVTRKTTPEAQAVTEADKDKYRLFVTVSADPPPGSSMTPEDPFWKGAQLSIPWLAPGESVVLAATLEHIQGQDLDKDFTNGVGHMKAVETCYSPNSSWDWVPCQNGGSDAWDFTILWNSALQLQGAMQQGATGQP